MSDISSSSMGPQKPKLVKRLSPIEDSVRKVFGDNSLKDLDELRKYNECKNRAEFAVLKGFGHAPLYEIEVGRQYYYPRRENYVDFLSFIWKEVIVVKELVNFSYHKTLIHCVEWDRNFEKLDIELDYRVISPHTYDLNAYYESRLREELNLCFGEEWKL